MSQGMVHISQEMIDNAGGGPLPECVRRVRFILEDAGCVVAPHEVEIQEASKLRAQAHELIKEANRLDGAGQ